DYYGVSEASAIARDNGGVIINGNDLMDANKWFTAIGSGDTVPQYYTYSATNVRLQEATIGYTFPRKLMKDVCDITLQLVGRNLWMIYNKAPFDPESIATTGSYYQGIDYFMNPATRNFGFNIRIKF
ncbi:MAG: SusC/RagA family protein, partial [Candidatus Cryptobacteroides sp.]